MISLAPAVQAVEPYSCSGSDGLSHHDYYSMIAQFESAPLNYIDLLGAIIRSGLKQEGPDYLLTDGGQYWCAMGNLNPSAVRKLAMKYDRPNRRGIAPLHQQAKAA